ncbi:hypothetical protein FFLO_04866 [Filobasidium floriforme]|uniref:Integrase core domain-containing protein n=1 Tax=Filobasidium floriforme TaxID=5210 RepID=A0A8K0JJK0_9TREE|nr:uncharacterized protein HD553DRAFT_327131 [Filobasidium floriforme]KAG7530696.1 hypothetical protein FFLO_04866 [Filobasidium floriforme]KAH8077803.1 hypothetical protein HD553DRAFT_327131 [Filobasidium floriforme]
MSGTNHYNRNSEGRNQWNTQVNVETLEPILRHLVDGENIVHRPTLLKRLLQEYGIQISRSTLNKYLKQFNLGGPKRAGFSIEQVEGVIVMHIRQHDPQNTDSPARIAAALGSRGIHIARDMVRAVMKTHFPEGFDQRSRSATNKTSHNAVIQSYGPNDQLSIDGHDKLSSIGFPIYGMRDKFSRKWITLVAVPNNRTNVITSYLYLKTIRDMGGIPLQVTSDHGNEVMDIFGYQSALRETAVAPLADLIAKLDIGVAPEPHRFLSSTRNITVERGWKPLVTKFNRKILVSTTNAIASGDYIVDNRSHRVIYLFLMAPLVLEELEMYKKAANCQVIRRQKGISLPSGMSANTAYTSEGQDCLLRLSPDSLDQVDRWIVDIEAAYPRLLCFLTWDEKSWVMLLWNHVCSVTGEQALPKVSLLNIWSTFRLMTGHITDIPCLVNE